MTHDVVAVTLATAGHVDHGKTALVAALTGHDTDRLAEEKARGISIALGFAPLDLGGRRVSLVDVPGHERFVRHMVAGASGVDGFLLCVAADDGVMPQTLEHMAVLDLLGVRDGVVAVTKSDVADPSPAAEAVRAIVPTGTPVVPVSAVTGAGVDALRDALADLVGRIGRRVGAGRSRLYVDRAFSVAGAGTVVTGTLWGAPLATGDRVRIHPGARSARIRSIEAHDRPVDRAGGGRVALALAAVARDQVPRGAVVVREGDGWEETTLLDVELTWLPDAGGPLRTRRRLQAFLGTTEASATCVLLDAIELAPGTTGYAQLRFDTPVVAAAGDRLVLRSAERRTVGGCRVVDAHPARHGRGSGAAERLAVLDQGDPTEVLGLRLAESGPDGLAIDDVDAADLGRLDAEMVAGRLHPAARVAVARDRIRGLSGLPGAPRATVVAAGPLTPDAMEALVAGLVAGGELVERGGRLTLGGATPDDASPQEVRVLDVLRAHGRRPPGPGDLVEMTALPDAVLTAALTALRERGEVVRAGDLWFARDAVDEAVAMAVDHLGAGPRGIGELRDLWDVGRRHALALAAHMDGEGLTLRRGDVRVLRRSRA